MAERVCAAFGIGEPVHGLIIVVIVIVGVLWIVSVLLHGGPAWRTVFP